MASQHYAALHEEERSRGTARLFAVVCLAAILGLALGLAWSVGWWQGKGDGYPLRLALPASIVPEPQIDVLSTDGDPANASGETKRSDGPATDELIAALDGSGEAQMPTNDVPTRDATGILSLDYDLAQLAVANNGYDSSDGSIETALPMLVNGVASGNAQIRVEDNAKILIAASSVARALGDRRDGISPRITAALDEGTGFLLFNDLRAAGIGVEYDPVRNRIALSLPS